MISTASILLHKGAQVGCFFPSQKEKSTQEKTFKGALTQHTVFNGHQCFIWTMTHTLHGYQHTLSWRLKLKFSTLTSGVIASFPFQCCPCHWANCHHLISRSYYQSQLTEDVSRGRGALDIWMLYVVWPTVLCPPQESKSNQFLKAYLSQCVQQQRWGETFTFH